MPLDPTRHSAKVTRLIAEKLAKLARSFESVGHHAEAVAAFLMRCLFTFFAGDVGLLRPEPAEGIDRPGEQPFTDLLKTLRGHAAQFVPMVLIEAGESDWSDVEPAIYGTLLERALEPRERRRRWRGRGRTGRNGCCRRRARASCVP